MFINVEIVNEKCTNCGTLIDPDAWQDGIELKTILIMKDCPVCQEKGLTEAFLRKKFQQKDCKNEIQV